MSIDHPPRVLLALAFSTNGHSWVFTFPPLFFFLFLFVSRLPPLKGGRFLFLRLQMANVAQFWVLPPPTPATRWRNPLSPFFDFERFGVAFLSHGTGTPVFPMLLFSLPPPAIPPYFFLLFLLLRPFGGPSVLPSHC